MLRRNIPGRYGTWASDDDDDTRGDEDEDEASVPDDPEPEPPESRAVPEALRYGEAPAAAGKTGETVVHSAYYFVAAEYYKLAGPPEKFYVSALRYLSYTELEARRDAARGGAAGG